MSEYKLLVMANPLPGAERDFERWYDVHTRELLNNAPHVLGAQRFRRVDAEAGDCAAHQHLVIADWHADDLDRSWSRHAAGFQAGVAEGRFTPVPAAFDAASSKHWFFEAIEPHMTGVR